jgi:hypothetical protein
LSIAGAFRALADLARLCGRDREHDVCAHAAARLDAGDATSTKSFDGAPLSTLGLDPDLLTALDWAPPGDLSRALAISLRRLRRFDATVGDITLLASSPEPSAAVAAVSAVAAVDDGSRRATS